MTLTAKATTSSTTTSYDCDNHYESTNHNCHATATSMATTTAAKTAPATDISPQLPSVLATPVKAAMETAQMQGALQAAQRANCRCLSWQSKASIAS